MDPEWGGLPRRPDKIKFPIGRTAAWDPKDTRGGRPCDPTIPLVVRVVITVGEAAREQIPVRFRRGRGFTLRPGGLKGRRPAAVAMPPAARAAPRVVVAVPTPKSLARTAPPMKTVLPALSVACSPVIGQSRATTPSLLTTPSTGRSTLHGRQTAAPLLYRAVKDSQWNYKRSIHPGSASHLGQCETRKRPGAIPFEADYCMLTRNNCTDAAYRPGINYKFVGQYSSCPLIATGVLGHRDTFYRLRLPASHASARSKSNTNNRYANRKIDHRQFREVSNRS